MLVKNANGRRCKTSSRATCRGMRSQSRRPQTRRLDGQITSATARKRGGYRNLGGEVGGCLLLEPGMAAFKMVGGGGAYFKMILGQSSKWIWGKLQNGCGAPLTHYCSWRARRIEAERIREPDGQRESRQFTKDQEVRTTVAYHY